ncbi:MAG TPA: hypothetical protein VGG16_13335 [Streptosporangiaceae bacterium]
MSESPMDGSESQSSEGQSSEGQSSESQPSDEGQAFGDQHGDSRPASEPEGKPADGRYSDWRTDGSVGRFTEPPNVPSSTPADKPAEGRVSKPSSGRQGSGRQGRQSGDAVSDMQRWLMKAGARSMANQVAGNVRRSLGQTQAKRDKGDIWGTATSEPPPDEPPECQWCPVCQAARRMRASGPGLGDRLASAGGVLASVVQDAFSAVEQVMKTPPPDESHQDKAS